MSIAIASSQQPRLNGHDQDPDQTPTYQLSDHLLAVLSAAGLLPRRTAEPVAEARSESLFEAIGRDHAALVVEEFGHIDDWIVLRTLRALVGDAS